MQLLPNNSLENVLKNEKKGLAQKGWNPTKKYICLIGIADAMRYMHEHKIIHRDLKPGNIVLNENLEPIICDFGLSKYIDDLRTTIKNSENVGTPLYMAPEILDGDYSFKIDVYSFSLIAYQLMTGEEPFGDSKYNSYKLLTNVLYENERPKFKKDIPQKMKDLIEKCWDRNPDERYSFDQIVDILKSDYSLSPEDVDSDEIDKYLKKLEEFQKKKFSKNRRK